MQQLRGTIESILEVLKNKTMDAESRRNRIRDLIHERFYFRAMSQRALSRNWRKANSEQQKQFVALFSRLLEKTYLGRIEAYTNEKVKYVREKNKNAKRAVVYTEIITQKADIPIDYKLAKKGNKWLVYDVVIEQVSLISNYRTSYAEIIKKSGIDGLLAQMEKKLQEQDKAEAEADKV